jgi:phosphoribosylanthranilate isomerase
MTGGIIKICGLTYPPNIRQVLALKPDWIGLIFYPPSPRFVKDPGKLDFLDETDPSVRKLGVFVNPKYDEIMEVTTRIHFDGIQLHGRETPEFCQRMRNEGFRVIKSFGISPDFDFNLTHHYAESVDYFLFDTGSPKYGGTGEQFDWDLLYDYEGDTPFLLSGGLSPDTRVFPDHPRFAGVDLNSRFETAPGIKDIGKLQQFINQFRNE